jgi:hypothetical protein
MTLYSLEFVESIGVAEERSRKVTKNIAQGFELGEKPIYPRYVYQSVQYADAFQLAAGYARSITVQEYSYEETYSRFLHKVFADEFEAQDAFGKRLHKKLVEQVSVRDTLLRNANAVMYDVVLRSDTLSLDDLNLVADSPPVGYTPFKIFYPGDYEFEKAMIGVRIRSFDTTARAGILGLKHNVDVPDITDRGSSTVGPTETAGKTVTFSKDFAVPPEVYAVFAEGATAAVAEITGVTENDFTFILRDVSSPSTLVEGTITWAAIGR